MTTTTTLIDPRPQDLEPDEKTDLLDSEGPVFPEASEFLKARANGPRQSSALWLDHVGAENVIRGPHAGVCTHG